MRPGVFQTSRDREGAVFATHDPTYGIYSTNSLASQDAGIAAIGALGSKRGIRRPSISVNPYSSASSNTHSSFPLRRAAFGSAASAATARPMYSGDSLRS